MQQCVWENRKQYATMCVENRVSSLPLLILIIAFFAL